MQGPYTLGTHKAMTDVPVWEKGLLVRGEHYRVITQFVDADGDMHPKGEEWVFVGSIFSPMDDDLLLAVRKDDHDSEWRIRLHWSVEAQEHVIENIRDYIRVR